MILSALSVSWQTLLSPEHSVVGSSPALTQVRCSISRAQRSAKFCSTLALPSPLHSSSSLAQNYHYLVAQLLLEALLTTSITLKQSFG